MSPAYDTEASELQQQIEQILMAVDLANQSLSRSRVIPEDVAELVDAFDVLLYPEKPDYFTGVDPYLVENLLGGALISVKALREEDPEYGRRRLRHGLEQVRQALRDMSDEHPSSEQVPAKDVARWLVATLAVPQAELATLLATTPRTLQRWASPTETSGPSGYEESRLRIVARITNQLRHSFTGPGVVRWFERPHPMLDDLPPIDLLEDPTEYPRLSRLASRARSMVAT